jgi:hypothetical protein
MLPPFATHLLKKLLMDGAVPFALPAAGLPGTRGGYALLARISHFFATSAVTADALLLIDPAATQTNAPNVLPVFRMSSMTYLTMVRCSLIPERGELETGSLLLPLGNSWRLGGYKSGRDVNISGELER